MTRAFKGRTFYSAERDPEVLYHETVDEAVMDYLEDLEEGEEPEPFLTVYKWRSSTVPSDWVGRFAGACLKSVLDNLDEEYRQGSVDAFEPTTAMKVAELAFLTLVAKEFDAWNCERDGELTVSTGHWISENKHLLGMEK